MQDGASGRQASPRPARLGCRGCYRRRVGVGGREREAARRGRAQPLDLAPQATEVPGVKVFRSSATVYFANAELYSDALKQRVRLGAPVRGCVSEGPPPHRDHALPPALCLQCGVDVDRLISRKKLLLQRTLESGRHKGTVRKQAGPGPPRLLASRLPLPPPPMPQGPAQGPWQARLPPACGPVRGLSHLWLHLELSRPHLHPAWPPWGPSLSSWPTYLPTARRGRQACLPCRHVTAGRAFYCPSSWPRLPPARTRLSLSMSTPASETLRAAVRRPARPRRGWWWERAAGAAGRGANYGPQESHGLAAVGSRLCRWQGCGWQIRGSGGPRDAPRHSTYWLALLLVRGLDVRPRICRTYWTPVCAPRWRDVLGVWERVESVGCQAQLEAQAGPGICVCAHV